MGWDLDGIVVDLSIFTNAIKDKNRNRDKSKFKNIFYYLISLYESSELYTRNLLFGDIYHSFTTSEEIYNLTGIYSISYENDFSMRGVFCSHNRSFHTLRFDDINLNFKIDRLNRLSISCNTDFITHFDSFILWFNDEVCKNPLIKDLIDVNLIGIGNEKLSYTWDYIISCHILSNSLSIYLVDDFKSNINVNNLNMFVDFLSNCKGFAYNELHLLSLHSFIRYDKEKMLSYLDVLSQYFSTIYLDLNFLVLHDISVESLQGLLDILKSNQYNLKVYFPLNMYYKNHEVCRLLKDYIL